MHHDAADARQLIAGAPNLAAVGGFQREKERAPDAHGLLKSPPGGASVTAGRPNFPSCWVRLSSFLHLDSG